MFTVDQMIQVRFPALNKQPDLENNARSIRDYRSDVSTCKVRKVVSVPPEVYDALGATLLADTSIYERIGGSEADGFEGVTFEQLVSDPAMLARFRKTCWTNVVVVTDGSRTFIVNTEGYDYARYVGEVESDEEEVS